MNNEPVALKVNKGEICYLSKEDDQSYGMWCPINYDTQHGFPEGTKFYTHPANVDAVNTSKQYVDKSQNNRHDLTNDEIIEIRQEVWDDNKFISEIFFDFARAILRKAQEK